MKKEKIETEIIKEFERFHPKYSEGLTDDQVSLRFTQGLNNDNQRKNGKSIGQIILKNTFTIFNIIYLAIFIFLLFAELKGMKEGTPFNIMDFSFVVIVLTNTLIGTFQEIRSKKNIDRLTLLSTPTVTVIRNTKKQEVKVNDLVLDDIVYLTPGRQIVSDSILVDGEVEVNESQLTGESIAIRKQKGDVLYSGSFVVSGNCKCQVERVGKDNQIEKLTSQAKTYKKPESQILKTFNLMISFICVFLVVSGAILFIKNYSIGLPVYKAAKNTSTALLGMIPSGLYLLTSVALAVSVFRLSIQHTLVQDMYCIEMLARVNVLCLDKTGTITDGSMSVLRYIDYQKNKYPIEDLIGSMNTALQETNSTAKALVSYFGYSKKYNAKEISAFSSDRKYSAVNFGTGETYVLGAPEFVLKSSFDKYANEINDYANHGLRVLALAHSAYDLKEGTVVRVPKLVALILIEDQIRPEAYDTIRYFKEAGVQVKVISGDNPVTVSNVAKRVGVENAENYLSLDGLTDDEVYAAATSYTVFGRVKPNQKKILVKALKDQKKTVAMTGDGVNDIPALKEADCSIAMASGSDSVRSVAQLVLLDSNFASMPKIVDEGRRCINNIQKTAMLYLVKNLFIIILTILSITGFIEKNCSELSTSNGLFPFTNPAQLLMIEAFAIGIPSMFLALQPNHRAVSGKFLWNILKGALPGAIAIGISTIVTYVLSAKCGMNSEQITTIVVMVATVICLMVLWNACRPFNIWKSFLFIFMIALCSLVICGSWFDWNFLGIHFQKSFQLVTLFTTFESGESGKEVWNLTNILLTFSLVALGYVIMTGCSYIIHDLETLVDSIREKSQKKKN
jgi:cation-transporting ATPase E